MLSDRRRDALGPGPIQDYRHWSICLQHRQHFPEHRHAAHAVSYRLELGSKKWSLLRWNQSSLQYLVLFPPTRNEGPVLRRD